MYYWWCHISGDQFVSHFVIMTVLEFIRCSFSGRERVQRTINQTLKNWLMRSKFAEKWGQVMLKL